MIGTNYLLLVIELCVVEISMELYIFRYGTISMELYLWNWCITIVVEHNPTNIYLMHSCVQASLRQASGSGIKILLPTQHQHTRAGSNMQVSTAVTCWT